MMTDPVPGTRADRHVLTPSGLNRLVRDLLADALPRVWVEGELSNLARPASGHMYFTLKDARAQIRCAMFKPQSTWLKFRPAAGDKVLVHARVGLYEARGDYQLVVEHMEEAGAGALQRQFEELKMRLDAEGLFDPGRKRPLPRFARRIGVITSASGAAVRDVLQVLARRFPLAEVEVLPVPVQGNEAPVAIVTMLRKAGSAARHDVLLVTRGGGSLEDLAAFNDEAVARAIHASPVPVLSAIGHEIDFTICDFVADVRAPTPSAAAELLVPDALDMQHRLGHHERRLHEMMQRRTRTDGQRLDHLLARLQSQSPRQHLARQAERMHAARARLRYLSELGVREHRRHLAALDARLHAQHPRHALARRQDALRQWQRRLLAAMRLHDERQQQRLKQALRALRAVSPLATLERGYAIVTDASGDAVTSSKTVALDAEVVARLADGNMRLKRIDSPGH